jgi:hypothetical protein
VISTMRRHRLGSWTLPSGNSCDVFIIGSDGAIRRMAFEWDSPPPFRDVADRVDYMMRVLREVTRRAQEYLERPGRAVVVTL